MSQWISCADSLPECLFECDEDDTLKSHAVLVTDARDPLTLGMAHFRQDGTWKLYGGEHDFMYPEQISHWMPLPRSPFYTRPADVTRNA